MSSAAVLARVSTELQTLLQDALREDHLFPTLSVVQTDPSKPDVGAANPMRLSMWLYQVVPDEFLRNLPPTTVSAPKPPPGQKPKVRPTPLPLNLYYLLTPMTGAWDSDQRALGLAMLTLHENSTITLHIPDEDVSEELRIGLVSNQWEDRVRLWEALSEPYRLSVCYVVRTVRLDPPVEDAGARVIETTSALGDVPIATAKAE